jgi:hypothetical protein
MVDDRFTAQDSSRQAGIFRSRLAGLFERLPMLAGFHVTAELAVELTVQPGWVATPEMADEIRAALEDLISDAGAEETAELLRGRTFARAFH